MQGSKGAGEWGTLAPELAEVLAQLVAAPPPFGDMGRFLQAVAAGGALPAVPPGLPAPIDGILAALVEGLEE